MRSHARVPIALGLAGALWAVGCTESDKSRNPLSPDVAGPIAGVTISAPAPSEPANGAEVTAGEPITLAFKNAGTNGERPLRQHVQLARDQEFSELIVNADKVPLSEEGQTQYRVPEELPPNETYYWRARGLDGANTGSFSAPVSFKVVAAVVIEPPVPAQPADGSVTENMTPPLVVNNGQVSGPAGQVVYRFDVAKDAGFESMVAVLTVPRSEDAQTSAPLGAVEHNQQFFWRVQAGNGSVTSEWSPTVSFRTPEEPAGPEPPPAPAPPPGNPPPDPDPSPDPDPPPAPPPGGGGNRAPDPPGGQYLPSPGYGPSVVQQVAQQFPDDLRHSCQEDEGARGWVFLDRVVAALRQHDTRWGYNCKRGNCGDPSRDVVSYHAAAGPEVEGARGVWVIDVLTGHCGPSPTPGWLNHGYEPGGGAGWTSRGKF